MDLPPRPESGDADNATESGAGPATRPKMPVWVKVSLIIAAVLVIAFLVIMLTGLGGEHGPSRHLPGGGNPPTQHTP
jgi:hypothetical protein